MSILTEVTVRKHPIWVKIGDFLSRMTLKFDGWHWKTIGHLFHAASSFLDHSKAISEFKLELQPEKAKFGSKSAIFLSRVTLKFDGWPWKTIGHLFDATSSFVHQFKAGLIQTRVTVRKRQIWVKIDDFFRRVTLKFGGWPWKTLGHLS